MEGILIFIVVYPFVPKHLSDLIGCCNFFQRCIASPVNFAFGLIIT